MFRGDWFDSVGFSVAAAVTNKKIFAHGGGSTFSMILFKIFLVSSDFELKKIKNADRELSGKN